MTEQDNNPAVFLPTEADEDTQLRYALTRLQICVAENNALARYPIEVLRDDVRLALEAFRVTRDDLTAAWANGKRIQEENVQLRTLLQAVMDAPWEDQGEVIAVK